MEIDYKKFGFLPYQVAWLEDTSQIKLYEKSRRIGLTYVQAFEDVLDAGVYGKYDVWFSSNNETNAREYIEYVKKFASALSVAISVDGGIELLKNDDAQTFVVRFSNGKKITGLSSSPNQLHGKGGKIVLDEFARRDNELEVWEAASPAALVWGYPIRIISTHRGKQSLFYSFTKRLERGELEWSHHKTTFTDAVGQGLADKALKKRCTQAEREDFISQIRKSVGDSTIWAQQFQCKAMDENETFLAYTCLEKAGHAELLSLEELKVGSITATAFMKFQAFTTAAVEDDKLRAKIKDALSENIDTGKGSREFKKSIDSVFDKAGVTKLKPHQINNIYETNTSLAYGAGQMDAMVSVSGDFPYWKYSATLDGKTRHSHRALHGKIFKVGDFVFFPPIGFKCRCTAIPLTARQAGKYPKSEMPGASNRKELESSLESAEFVGNKQKNYLSWLTEKYKTADTQTQEYIDSAILIMRDEIEELEPIEPKVNIEEIDNLEREGSNS